MTNKKEFNLSEKRQEVEDNDYVYPEEDVKEFIKLLKEECSFCVDVINKLAGPKLTK